MVKRLLSVVGMIVDNPRAKRVWFGVWPKTDPEHLTSTVCSVSHAQVEEGSATLCVREGFLRLEREIRNSCNIVGSDGKAPFLILSIIVLVLIRVPTNSNRGQLSRRKPGKRVRVIMAILPIDMSGFPKSEQEDMVA